MNNLSSLISKGILSVGVLCMMKFFMPANVYGQTLHWSKQLGSADWDEGNGVVTDDYGHVYSIGAFYDTLDLDPGPGVFNFIPKGAKDVFISKYDEAGNFIWAKQIGGGWVECNAITLDANGHIYITGSFLGTTDFDPAPADSLNLSSTDDINAFTCKLDSAGNLIWAKQIGATLAVNSYAVAVDGSGNVYTTGYFDGTVDLDPGAGVFSRTVLGYSDLYISKLDAAGNFVWAKQMSGLDGEVGYGIAVDASGNVYTTGTFFGTVDFDPGAGVFSLSAPPMETNIFVSKLDASGSFSWAKQLGGATGLTIALDNAGNVYVGGSGYYSWNGIAINKLDPAGNNIWVKEIMAYSCWSLAVDDDYNVYFTGEFFGTKDFDPGAGIFNMSSTGSTDSYISKLDSGGHFAWARQLGGTDIVSSRALAVSSNDNVYTTGYFGGTTDFDPGAVTYNLSAVGSYDIFLHKMKPENLGIGAPNLTGMFNIYPNPTSGKFTIQFEKGYSGVDLVLRNMVGQIVDKRSVNNSRKIELEINEANGVYMLEVCDQNGKKSVVRVVKN